MSEWKETVVLIDADHLDSVCFNLIVNFERMLGRRIPQTDLCHWLDCIALDGGLRPGDNEVQVIFLHSKDKEKMANMNPGIFNKELNGQAFKDHLAEFTLASFPVEEVVTMADFYMQSLDALIEAKDVKRILLVAALEEYGDRVRQTAIKAEDKDIVVFTMQPTQERGYLQELLGYSLMSALGIRGEELQG